VLCRRIQRRLLSSVEEERVGARGGHTCSTNETRSRSLGGTASSGSFRKP
jgi:hypothetical protein